MLKFVYDHQSLNVYKLIQEFLVCVSWQTQVQEVFRNLILIIKIKEMKDSLEHFAVLLLEDVEKLYVVGHISRLYWLSHLIKHSVRINMVVNLNRLWSCCFLFHNVSFVVDSNLGHLTVVNVEWIAVLVYSEESTFPVDRFTRFIRLFEHNEKITFRRLLFRPNFLRTGKEVSA